MKKKSSDKAKKETTPEPPPVAYVVVHGKIAEEDFQIGVKLPDCEYPPPLPNILEFAVRKFFPELERGAPGWAKQAAKMAFKSAMPPERKRNASGKYMEGFMTGKFSEAEKLLPPERIPPSPAAYGGLTERDIAAKLPSNEAADFFCGLRDGEKAVQNMIERVKTLQTVKAYQAIAIHWREAKDCEGNAGKLHQWLMDKGAIHYKTDPAATRTICKKIGFPKRSKAGRPTLAEE